MYPSSYIKLRIKESMGLRRERKECPERVGAESRKIYHWLTNHEIVVDLLNNISLVGELIVLHSVLGLSQVVQQGHLVCVNTSYTTDTVEDSE